MINKINDFQAFGSKVYIKSAQGRTDVTLGSFDYRGRNYYSKEKINNLAESVKELENNGNSDVVVITLPPNDVLGYINLEVRKLNDGVLYKSEKAEGNFYLIDDYSVVGAYERAQKSLTPVKTSGYMQGIYGHVEPLYNYLV